jgi:hypothetical protein
MNNYIIPFYPNKFLIGTNLVTPNNVIQDSYNSPPSNNCRGFRCNRNLTGEDPISQYQRLKLIWNTVRVPSTLYMSDLAALTVYQHPRLYEGVNWNQMSDRYQRHVQPVTVAGGSSYHVSSTRHSITRPRPNAGCPGGSGVDIKHNSYDRYLRRLVGRGPARRGVIPPNYGKPIVFNPTFPIYGGKTTKTSIVGENCNCPFDSNLDDIFEIKERPFETEVCICCCEPCNCCLQEE